MPWVRPAAPSELAAKIRKGNWPVDCVVELKSLGEALEWAKSGSHVVVCGSLYLVSDYYRTLMQG